MNKIQKLSIIATTSFLLLSPAYKKNVFLEIPHNKGFLSLNSNTDNQYPTPRYYDSTRSVEYEPKDNDVICLIFPDGFSELSIKTLLLDLHIEESCSLLRTKLNSLDNNSDRDTIHIFWPQKPTYSFFKSEPLFITKGELNKISSTAQPFKKNDWTKTELVGHTDEILCFKNAAEYFIAHDNTIESIEIEKIQDILQGDATNFDFNILKSAFLHHEANETLDPELLYWNKSLYPGLRSRDLFEWLIQKKQFSKRENL